MGKKGFVITLDAFLSLVLVLVLVFAAYSAISGTTATAWDTVQLKTLAQDEATVLQKSRAADAANFVWSGMDLVEIMNVSPVRVCFESSILYGPDRSVLVHALKTGCVKNASEIVAVERSFVTIGVSDPSLIANDIIRVEAWWA